jgi:hypothetical protein
MLYASLHVFNPAPVFKLSQGPIAHGIEAQDSPLNRNVSH